MLCKAGQYYETAVEQCKSCEIPCSLSKDVCKDLGCELFAIGSKENPSTTTNLQTTLKDSGLMGDAEGHTTVIIWALFAAALLSVLTLGLIIIAVVLNRRKLVEKRSRGSSSHLLTGTSESHSGKLTMKGGTQALDDTDNFGGYC